MQHENLCTTPPRDSASTPWINIKRTSFLVPAPTADSTTLNDVHATQDSSHMAPGEQGPGRCRN